MKEINAGDNFRHEFKYFVNEHQIALLKSRLSAVMTPDPHCVQNKSYFIRSLYFDDMNHSSYFDVFAGVDNREKFRVRLYNHDDGKISLEKKCKIHGMTYKQAAHLSKSQAEMLIARKVPDFLRADPLLRELCLAVLSRGMHPSVIVDYDRYAFISPLGNVRITFDTNISASVGNADIFDRDILRVPLLPKGQHILEVKYDEFIPDVISSLLSVDGELTPTAFSKYVLAKSAQNSFGLKTVI